MVCLHIILNIIKKIFYAQRKNILNILKKRKISVILINRLPTIVNAFFLIRNYMYFLQYS